MPENPVHPDIKVQPVSNVDASLKSIPVPQKINIRMVILILTGFVVLIGITYYVLNQELYKYITKRKKEAEIFTQSLITPTPKEEPKATDILINPSASESSIITVPNTASVSADTVDTSN